MTNKTLNELKVGCKSTIINIIASKETKRRLQDLGFIKGSNVEAVLISPLGEPTAYKIKGTVIALRAEEALKIQIE